MGKRSIGRQAARECMSKKLNQQLNQNELLKFIVQEAEKPP
jgi:RNA-binding protein YhbY